MKKAVQIGKLVGWTLGVIGLMVCLGFSAKESEKIKCEEIEVLIDHASGNSFVTEADIKEILYSKVIASLADHSEPANNDLRETDQRAS